MESCPSADIQNSATAIIEGYLINVDGCTGSKKFANRERVYITIITAYKKSCFCITVIEVEES